MPGVWLVGMPQREFDMNRFIAGNLLWESGLEDGLIEGKERRQLARGRASRQALLDVATRMFLKKGYANSSVAEIVREAGLPAPSLYHHFGSKQNLLAAVIEARGQWVRDDCITDPEASIEANIATLVQHARAHFKDHVVGLRLRLSLTFEEDDTLKEMVVSGRKQSHQGLADQIAKIDALSGRPKGVAAAIADAYLTGMQGICLDYLLRPRTQKELDRSFALLEYSLCHVAELELNSKA